MNKLTYALSIGVAIAVIGCPEENSQQMAPPQPRVAQAPVSQPANGMQPASDVTAGKRLYLTACANCHGPDGSGSMMRQALPTIGDLTSPEMHGRLSDADIANLIQNGRNNKMPAFGTMFDDNQRKAIVAYVRTLKRQ